MLERWWGGLCLAWLSWKRHWGTLCFLSTGVRKQRILTTTKLKHTESWIPSPLCSVFQQPWSFPMCISWSTRPLRCSVNLAQPMYLFLPIQFSHIWKVYQTLFCNQTQKFTIFMAWLMTEDSCNRDTYLSLFNSISQVYLSTDLKKKLCQT